MFVVIFTWKCKSYCITINFFSNLYRKFNQILVVIEFAYILPVQTYQCLWYSFRKKMETKNSAIKIFKEFWFNIKFGFRNTCTWLLILYMCISCTVGFWDQDVFISLIIDNDYKSTWNQINNWIILKKFIDIQS